MIIFFKVSTNSNFCEDKFLNINLICLCGYTDLGTLHSLYKTRVKGYFEYIIIFK